MGEGRREHSGKREFHRQAGAGGCRPTGNLGGPGGGGCPALHWELKEVGGGQGLDWCGHGGGRGPGWLRARCCLHVRVTLGRSPHLSERQPSGLPPSVVGLAKSEVWAWVAPSTSCLPVLPLSCSMAALLLTLSVYSGPLSLNFWK